MDNFPNIQHQNVLRNSEASEWPRFQFEREFTGYDVTSFSERQNPEGALRAQQIQGESYVTAGFVFESALDEYGRLQPELDRSRGDNVEYFLATAQNPTDASEMNQASVRLIHLPEDGALDDLAAYKYCKHTLSPEHEAELRSLIATEGARSVVEIAALSKTNAAPSIASFEVIRDIVQQAVRGDTKEVWLATLAESAYQAMYDNFGPRSLTQVGERVPVDVGDPRTSEQLRLVPSLIRPREVMDGIVEDLAVITDSKQQVRLARSLVFLSDGLGDQEMSTSVKDTVTMLKSMMPKGA